MKFWGLKMFRAYRVALLLMICVTLSACQNGGPQPSKKYPVSGTVTLNGEPVSDEALIYFKTIATGAIDVIKIESGKYSGATEAGERRVEIYDFHVQIKNFSGMETEVKESLIPARYNTESTLTAKVTPDGPNEFKFELSSK